MLKSGASEAEVYTKIEEYKEKFADYGRDRRSAIEFHLRNIERLLMPTQTTSLVLTTLQMDGSSSAGTGQGGSSSKSAVYSSAVTESSLTPNTFQSLPPVLSASVAVPVSVAASNLDAKTLFRRLVDVLQVTPEQAAALKDSRFVAEEMDECLKASLGVLEELRLRLAQCGEDLENEFNNVRSILTPTQAAKFLVWVANNKACMHMLNELWNRVYPQQKIHEQSPNEAPDASP